MGRVLRGQGVAPGRLVLDEASLDTLQSVIATARLVRQRGLHGALICSDRYHLPRIRLMLAVLGVTTQACKAARGHAGTQARYWLRMYLREALAIPYDVAIVIVRRREFMALIAG